MLRAELLGRGRQILPGEFSFRLQKVPLNPAWTGDVNVHPRILGWRNSKYSEPTVKFTVFTKVVLLYQKLKCNKEVQNKLKRENCSKKERAGVRPIPGFSAYLEFMFLLYNWEPALPENKPLF